MALITKPDFTYVWASGGAIVAPNDTKKQQGWVAEAPPFQYDNWLQNRQDQMLAHINQRGIAAWDGLTNYEAGGLSYVQGSDGKVYKSVAASGPVGVVQNPTTDVSNTYWSVAFAPLNSPAFTGVPTALTAAAGTNTTQIATTAFVTAAANLKANIASPAFTGIPTAPNPSTGLRSQALATMQKFADEFGSSLAANGYQKLPSGLIIQWGFAATGSATITFPIAFPTAACAVTGNTTLAGTPNSILIPQSITAANFYAKVNKASDATSVPDPFNWLAIGY